MYSDVLDTLEHDPLNGMCAPSLLGSSGYVPISIISLYVRGYMHETLDLT
jgi:hypothetical protein